MSQQAAIPLTCPHCDRSFRVRPAAAGRSVKCPGCGEVIAVPAQDPGPPELPTFMTPQAETNDSQADDPFADLAQFDVEPTPATDQWTAVSASPYQPPSAPSRPGSSSQVQIRSSSFTPRQYPALEMVRIILRVLAFLLIAICLLVVAMFSLAFLMTIGRVDSDGAAGLMGGGITGILLTSLPMLFTALTLFSYAELIKVFVDVQRNTQEAAHYLRLKG
jgi:predicted Zn finger-like uncharacterized protein